MNLYLRVAAIIFLAAPLISQVENPYFSLSSNRTFGSSDQPSVDLAGTGVTAVQIRVYHVNDPVKFYSQMEDAHSFGTYNPRRHGKRTWLEAIHDWKHELRRQIRVDLRDQFTESPSAHFANPVPTHDGAASLTRETYFAQAPVLNQERLVLSFIQPVSGANQWASTSVPIRVKDRGLYLVEAVHGNLRAYTLLTVSDLVMITKSSKSGILCYLVDRQTGQPVPRVPISVVQKHSGDVATQTDATGIANISKPGKTEDSLRLMAVKGTDVAFNELGFYDGAGSPVWSGYIYTDRPVYRPGDTVHFRGILRKQLAVGYETPSNVSVRVEINDPDGKSIYQKSLITNASGAIHGEIPIDKSSALGNFFIQIHGDESTMSGNFEVQEYKKPEYEVHVTPVQRRVLQGQQISAVIDSRYYFGEPVAGAKVSYSVHRSRYWFPYWFEPGEEVEANEDGSDEGGGPAGEEISQESGTLDSDGKLTISIATAPTDQREDFVYRIEAGVTDKAGREISGTGYVTATYGDFSVYAQPSSYVVTPGAPTELKVSARDYDNKPVSTSIHVEIAVWNARRHRMEGTVSSADVTTGEDGEALANITVPFTGGEMRIRTTAHSGNRMVKGTSYLWAPKENFDWGFSNQRNLKVVADKKTYKKGDKARILIICGRPNTALLVSIEGRQLRSYQLVRSESTTAVFEYNVTADDEPAFYINAEYIYSGALYQGDKRINVPPDDHKLSIRISTDKETYLPGQTAAYDVQATKPDGTPAANADLSLGVVDEAIYAIRPDQSGDILSFFYGREFNSVYTQTSLEYYFNGEAGTRRMQLATVRPASRLAQLKPEQLAKPKIRKYFPDTTFWQADITTDSNGHAKAQVPFPDSLTTWRSTVRGVAPGDQFGSQTAKVVVRKNLILRLATPRFFVQGDEVVISAVVHNYLRDSKKCRVGLKLEGLELLNGNANQDLEIPSRAEAKVDWRVKAAKIGSAKITSEALTNEESDAVELTLPVHPPGIAISEAKSGSIADSGTQQSTLTFPAGAVAGSRSISIRLSSPIAGSIFNALDFLTSFPYGCVEQTMSSFLPDLMVKKATQELGLKRQVDDAALQEKIQAGLDRLYSFQHPDGGWGWWVADETQSFMTAYVVAGLAEARGDGVPVHAEAISQGVKWLNKALTTDNDLEPDLSAYMEYALATAGHPNPSSINKTYAHRDQLSPYGVALLGLALEQAKDNRVSKLVDVLQGSVKDDGTEASWPATRDQMLDFEGDVTPESTAYAMKFLSHQTPKSSLLPKAALWLVNHRNEGFWWSSTKQTAMVIYGLIDYVRAANELHPDLTATITVNGRKIREQEFRGDNPPDGQEISLDDSQLLTGTNQITVNSAGHGRLYYSVAATHYSNEPRMEKQAAISLNLLRDYFRMAPQNSSGRITYALQPLEGSVAQGDMIAVRLTLTGSDWRYLLIEDPIPAGAEFIEKDKLYEIDNKPPWWQYWFSRRELKDDHMAIFERFFSEQQKQYFYLLKVVNPGVFKVNPARVQPMYQPGHLATTEGRTFEVTQ